MAKIFRSVLLFTIASFGGYLLYKQFFPGPLPQLDPEEWWGPNELKEKYDMSIRPFKVKFEEAMILDLKRRINNTRQFTKPLENVAFQYGFNTDQIQGWLQYWAHDYNFNQREKFLNQFQQFKTNIQGLDIHFIRVIPQVPAGVETVPILILHGWPGSVREFYESIPLLTKQQVGYDFAFEVIVPSLPGYGFSDAAVRPGLGAPQAAVVFRNLMHRLGHKKYYVQGGRWGSTIGSIMATLYPEDVLGFHSNSAYIKHNCAMVRTLIGSVFPSLIVESHLADRLYPLSAFFSYLLEEMGYSHIQATKLDTIGVSLTDSPAGLLAYILEKFSTWTSKEYKFQKDGGLLLKYTKDQLIDNLMIYWNTNTITTSMRFFAETLNRKVYDMNLDMHKTKVPTWALQAKNELVYQPPNLLKFKYTNLLNVTVLNDGGQFVALELPKVFAEDVFRAVKAFRQWRNVDQKSEL